MIRQSKGFSLLEILVVLVIIGIAVSGATVAINFGGPDKELDKAVERFVAYCQHASDAAVFEGEPVGLVLEPPAWRENPLDEGWRYSWVKRNFQGMWVALPELKAMELDKDFDIAIEIEEQLWEPDVDDLPEVLEPLVVFYPGGDVVMFRATFTHQEVDDTEEHVEVDEWGRVVWKERQELLEELEEESN